MKTAPQRVSPRAVKTAAAEIAPPVSNKREFPIWTYFGPPVRHKPLDTPENLPKEAARQVAQAEALIQFAREQPASESTVAPWNSRPRWRTFWSHWSTRDG
jgi:hypothetical protein